MAQWQIFKGTTPSGAPIQVGHIYDDGLLAVPSDDGFDTAPRDDEMKKRGGDAWAYVVRSTQVSAKMAGQIEADVEAIVSDESNDVSDEAVARKLVLASYGLNELQ